MGKEEEFLGHIKQHRGILNKICFAYSNSNEEFKDLYQEIMYQVWKSYGNFRGDSQMSTWLYKVALFTALAFLKKKPKQVHEDVEQTQLPAPEATSDERQEILKNAMNLLPETDKAVLLLYLEDHSYKEMADILGISESNIGVKINRIKKKLKTLMVKENGT